MCTCSLVTCRSPPLEGHLWSWFAMDTLVFCHSTALPQAHQLSLLSGLCLLPLYCSPPGPSVVAPLWSVSSATLLHSPRPISCRSSLVCVFCHSTALPQAHQLSLLSGLCLLPLYCSPPGPSVVAPLWSVSSATLLLSPRPISCRSSLVCVFCHSTALPQAHQLSLLSGLCLLPLYCTPPGPSVVAPLWSVSSATLLLSPRPISCRSSLVCDFCHSTALPQAHQLSLLSGLYILPLYCTPPGPSVVAPLWSVSSATLLHSPRPISCRSSLVCVFCHSTALPQAHQLSLLSGLCLLPLYCSPPGPSVVAPLWSVSSATLLHSPRPISCRSSLVCVFCHSTALPQAHQLSLLSGLCLLPLYCTPPGPSVVAPLWSVSSATLLLSPRPISCRSSLVCVFCHSTALPQAHQLSLLSGLCLLPLYCSPPGPSVVAPLWSVSSATLLHSPRPISCRSSLVCVFCHSTALPQAHQLSLLSGLCLLPLYCTPPGPSVVAPLWSVSSATLLHSPRPISCRSSLVCVFCHSTALPQAHQLSLLSGLCLLPLYCSPPGPSVVAPLWSVSSATLLHSPRPISCRSSLVCVFCHSTALPQAHQLSLLSGLCLLPLYCTPPGPSVVAPLWSVSSATLLHSPRPISCRSSLVCVFCHSTAGPSVVAPLWSVSSATLLHSPRPISCRSSLVCVFCHSTALPQAHQLSLLSGLCLLPLYCSPPGPSVVAPLWSVSSATLLLSPRPISCRSSLVCVFCHSTALPQAHQLSLLSGLCLLPLYCSPPGPSVVAPLWSVSSATLLHSPRPISCRSSLVCVFCHSTALPQAHQLSLLSGLCLLPLYCTPPGPSVVAPLWSVSSATLLHSPRPISCRSSLVCVFCHSTALPQAHQLSLLSGLCLLPLYCTPPGPSVVAPLWSVSSATLLHSPRPISCRSSLVCVFCHSTALPQAHQLSLLSGLCLLPLYCTPPGPSVVAPLWSVSSATLLLSPRPISCRSSLVCVFCHSTALPQAHQLSLLSGLCLLPLYCTPPGPSVVAPLWSVSSATLLHSPRPISCRSSLVCVFCHSTALPQAHQLSLLSGLCLLPLYCSPPGPSVVAPLWSVSSATLLLSPRPISCRSSLVCVFCHSTALPQAHQLSLLSGLCLLPLYCTPPGPSVVAPLWSVSSATLLHSPRPISCRSSLVCVFCHSTALPQAHQLSLLSGLCLLPLYCTPPGPSVVAPLWSVSSATLLHSPRPISCRSSLVCVFCTLLHFPRPISCRSSLVCVFCHSTALPQAHQLSFLSGL